MKRRVSLYVLLTCLFFACSPEKMPEGKQIGPNPDNPQGPTPQITVDNILIIFESASSSQTVNVTSNVEWIADCSDSWITTSKTSATQLSITASANTGESRSTNIYLRQQGKTINLATISISQKGVTEEPNENDNKEPEVP